MNFQYCRMNFSGKLLLLLLLLLGSSVQAQNLPSPMSPARLVNDFAGIFSVEEVNNLEQMLLAYNDSTSTQIYVVTVKDLDGYDISDYAFRLGEKWGVGQKGKDNGAVVLIKPKIGNSRGQVFIATGYGLEEKLNDARIGRIIDNYMLPYFQQNDYYTGTKDAIEAMIGYLSGQYQPDENNEELTVSDIVVGIVLMILLIYFISKNNKNRGNGSSRGGGFFPPIVGGGFGGFGGGSSSGGFGGGGGGRFGGGGAGRGW